MENTRILDAVPTIIILVPYITFDKTVIIQEVLGRTKSPTFPT
jgi:adenylyl- and sulfurtransferase ThiI